MIGQQELLEHVDLQHAETAAEIDLLLGGDVLVTEHHDVMIQMRLVNTGEIGVIKGFRQIEPDDLGTDLVGERADIKGLTGGLNGG
ncbi:hypothetical protein PS3A_05870 [Pseudomonas sp. 3A(2025)]